MNDERQQLSDAARLLAIEDALRLILWRLGAPDDLLRAWMRAAHASRDPLAVRLAMNNLLATLRGPSPLD